MMKLTILMPALNEEKSIGETIDKIPFENMVNMGYDAGVLIVDGGSTDRTIEIAKNKGAKIIETSRGYGWQYQVGFKNAEGEIIVTADSDCSYPMEEIPDLLKIFRENNLDFISTNRFAYMKNDSMRFINNIGNRILTFTTNFLFNLKLKDSQSGMWVIRKEILKDIKLTSKGMPLSQEIKIEAFKKFKAKEIDSSYRKRVGEVKLRKFKDGWDNLSHLFKKRLNLLK